MFKSIKQFFLNMITDRAGGTNSKIFWGCIFCVVMIVGLFVGVNEANYNIFSFCTMALLGLSCFDNWSAPKIEVTKTETKMKESKTEVDIASMVNNTVNRASNKRRDR